MKHKTSFTWINGLKRPDFWLSIILGYSIWYFGYVRPGIVFNLWFSVGAVTSLIIGIVLDIYSTWKAVILRSEFEEQGKDFPIFEVNPFLPEQPILKDFVTKKQIIIFLIVCILGFILPPFGFGQALGHTLQAIRNFRLRNWLLETVSKT